MKVLIFAAVALLAAASAEEVLREVAPEELTAFDYHNRFGIPEAAAIKLAEEQSVQDPSRIVGGSGASLGQFPYLGGLVISLTNGFTSVCGSSMVTNTRAVTAAHCWWDGNNQAWQFTVVLGSLTIFFGGTRVNSNQVVMHPNWSPWTISNDVAMIYLPWITFTNVIQPIALPVGNELNNNHVGAWAIVSGWGAQNVNQQQTGIPSNQMMHYTNVQVITNALCQQTFGNTIIASTLCTSGVGGRSTCGGDSGGPLVVFFNGRYVLVGVTSFGAAAGCTLGHPAAFARVTYFANWLRQHM